VDGREGIVALSDGRKVRTRYRAVKVSSLIPSNNATSFEPDPRYPAGVQGRAYHGARGTAARQQVELNTGKIDPDLLLDAGSRANGPPTITPEGVVVMGNQRTMMLQRARDMAPEAFQRYTAQLRAQARLFDIDPAKLADDEVLVREIIDDGIDVRDPKALGELNRVSDTPATKSKDVLSDAASRAGKLRQAEGALRHFSDTVEADETLRDYLDGAHGRAFVGRLVDDGVIAPQELGRYVDAATNKLTPQGKQTIEDMMYAAAIGDADVVSRAPGKILRKLEHAIPALVRAGGDYDLAPQLREALDLLAASQASASPRVKAFLEQPDMLGRAWSEEAKSLAVFLEGANKGQVTKAFRDYAEVAGGAARATESVDMFGHTPEAPSAARGRLFGEEGTRRGTLGPAELGTRMMGSIGGVGLGGAAGYKAGMSSEGTPEERRKKALAYALAGAGAGFALPWLKFKNSAPDFANPKEAAEWLETQLRPRPRKGDLSGMQREPMLRRAGGTIGQQPKDLERAADDVFKGSNGEDGLSTCTTGACAIAKKYRGTVVGYFSQDNPTAKLGANEGGHDFALVGNRYVVDPWAKHVDGSVQRATLDLEDPADAATARELYGDRSTWKAVEDYSRPQRAGAIGQQPEFRHAQRETLRLQTELDQAENATRSPILAYKGPKVYDAWRAMARAARWATEPAHLEQAVDDAITMGAYNPESKPQLLEQVRKINEAANKLRQHNTTLTMTEAPTSSSGVRFKYMAPTRIGVSVDFQTPKGDVRAVVIRTGEKEIELSAIGYVKDFDDNNLLKVKQSEENTLGLATMRDIGREMRELFPEVKVITGHRVGGVRGRRGGEQMAMRVGAIGEQPDMFGGGGSADDAASQGSLFGSEPKRSLKNHERAAASELEKLRLQVKLAKDPAVRQKFLRRKAELERLVNRDKAISADELATRAGADEPSLFGNRTGAIGIQPTAAPTKKAPARAAYLQDPDVQRVLQANQRAVNQIPKVGIMEKVHAAYQGLIDSVHGAKRVGEALDSSRLGIEAQRAAGWQAAATRRLEDEFAPVLQAAKGHEDGVVALADAERGLELLDNGYGKKVAGMDREELQRVVDRLSQVPEVRKGADELKAYYRQLLERRHDAGLIDDAQYFALVNNHQQYIPFVRDVEPGASAGASSGGALYNRGRGLRQMDAGDVGEEGPKLLDPFRQAVLDTFKLEQMIGKQRVVNVLSELVEADPAAASPFLRKLSPGEDARGGTEIKAIVNGKQERYVVTDDLLHQSLEGLAPDAHNAAVRLMAKFKKGLQVGVTTMPAFTIANAIRDSFMASVQYPLQARAALAGSAAGGAAGAALDKENPGRGAMLGATMGFGVGNWTPHIARTIKTTMEVIADERGWKKSAELAEFLKEGGGGFGFYAKDHKDADKVIRELKGEISWPRSMWDALQMVNRAIETAPRLNRFRYAKEKGASVAEAVVAGRDVSLDFGRRGGDRLVRGMAETTAFWNPKLQGVDKVFRTLNPATEAGRRAWMVGFSALTAPSVALWMVNKENPEYWSRPQWERNTFWLLPKEEGGFIRVPKPFEVGMLFASLPERILDFWHQRDPERLGQAMKDMGSTATEGLVPIPTAIQPLLENAVNFSFFRARPIVSDVLEKLPPELQSDGNTSTLAKKIGELAKYSPKKIDNLLQAWGGTAAGEVLNQTTKLARNAGLDDRPPSGVERTSQFSRFVTRPDQTSDDELALYRRFERAEAVLEGARTMAKQGQDAKGYIEKHREELTEYAQLKGARDVLTAVNNAKRQVQLRRDLTPSKKKELTLKLTLLSQRVAGAALREQQSPATGQKK
jgi:hypothetical protein